MRAVNFFSLSYLFIKKKRIELNLCALVRLAPELIHRCRPHKDRKLFLFLYLFLGVPLLSINEGENKVIESLKILV